ncbi:MAG TPA: hypothetical protein VFY68_06625 [Nitrososphaeraceae archaeon]|nr:hypothetical protein [Nitrososphaeraceae archaeon]
MSDKFLPANAQLIGSNSYITKCVQNAREPVVGVRELKDLLALSIDIQDLILLTKPID